MDNVILFALWLTALWIQGECVLKLSSYFGDHIVLQRGPRHAVIWGTAETEGDTVTVKVTGAGAGAGATLAPVTTKVSKGEWKVKLPPVTSKDSFVIDASSKDGHVVLHDVLFGDVWLCSGQSNMQFTMNQVFNFSAEVQHSLEFKTIRIAQVKMIESPTALSEATLGIKWSSPTTDTIRNFSAVCWLFGEYLQPHLNYPIGLVEASWGGSLIEAWSPPQAIQDCETTPAKRSPHDKLVYWNGMINPIASATIYGVLWYQGESNAGTSGKYPCQIQSLLKRWREIFNKNSLGETSLKFPFGFVQLAPIDPGTAIGQFPRTRWAQTVGYGYSPNPALPETFMAVTIDLPDFLSATKGTIHPRYKQDVARRLVFGALNIAYGHKDVVFQGPWPTSFIRGTKSDLTIIYDNGTTTVHLKVAAGFEICCSHVSSTQCREARDPWYPAIILRHVAANVTISTEACTGANHVVGVRYAWRNSPCALRECAVYGTTNELPAPPFIQLSIPA